MNSLLSLSLALKLIYCVATAYLLILIWVNYWPSRREPDASFRWVVNQLVTTVLVILAWFILFF